MYSSIVIWLITFRSIVFGLSVTFDPSKPAVGDSVVISCKRTSSGTTGMTFQADTTSVTTCSGTVDNDCFPVSPVGYTISTDASENVFNLSLASANVSECINFTCSDTVDTASSSLYIAKYTASDTVLEDPGAYTSGTISVITGCVLSTSDVTVTWKIVKGNGDLEDIDGTRTTNSTECSDTCHTQNSEKAISSITHTECNGSKCEEVTYRATISHSSYSGVTTKDSAKFRIPKDDDGLKWWIIVVICLGILCGLFLTGILIGAILLHFSHARWEGYWAPERKPLRIICCVLVVGLGLLLVRSLCNAKTENDHQLTEREKSSAPNAKPDDDQDKKPGNTVQPKPKSRDPEKGSTNKNDNTPKKVEKKPGRAQPPLPAVAASEAMHGREPDKRKKKHKRRLEESDSGVSRTDVELQDSSKLNKRPMPGIPQGHDSKGRGLSANFDDDHPMIGIDLPAKKAGALQPLHEGTGDQEPKKLKKKKKKKSEDYNDE